MAIRLLASAPSPAAKVAVDPWIPLSVVWDVEPDVSPLYLFVRDPDQGYVELKVHPESGALVGAVIIDLPRPDEHLRRLRGASTPQRSETAVLDLEIWPWKETPDYREPARRDIDVECPLSLTAASDQMTIWFSSLPVAQVLKAGPVEVGVSMEGELVAVMASGLAVVAE
ncbi:hypothetical protein KEM60_01156 [Austwickia sp. TVS 96-490-7B]|uniref:hypothetical protein n=1 Tax=Austwickia sp. TVS 96-490-7B TaxID=2830843 RepID=UPI001C57C47E|nr:hypothetical protein [Austwickia sp. TVS 96-490-7B]MBW3084965.1 hypothetical protein [Austwickia sp. TVS 96-490-7B]